MLHCTEISALRKNMTKNVITIIESLGILSYVMIVNHLRLAQATQQKFLGSRLQHEQAQLDPYSAIGLA